MKKLSFGRYLRKFLIANLLTLVLYLVLYPIWGAVFFGTFENSQSFLANLVLTLAVSTLFGWLLVVVTYQRTDVGEDREMKREALLPTGFMPRLRLMLAEEKPVLRLCAAVMLLDIVMNLLIGAGVVNHNLPGTLFFGLCGHRVWLNVPVLSSLFGFVYGTGCYLFFLCRYQNKWNAKWHPNNHST